MVPTLWLRYDEQLSHFAFNFNLRRYTKDTKDGKKAAAAAAVGTMATQAGVAVTVSAATHWDRVKRQGLTYV